MASLSSRTSDSARYPPPAIDMDVGMMLPEFREIRLKVPEPRPVPTRARSSKRSWRYASARSPRQRGRADQSISRRRGAILGRPSNRSRLKIVRSGPSSSIFRAAASGPSSVSRPATIALEVRSSSSKRTAESEHHACRHRQSSGSRLRRALVERDVRWAAGDGIKIGKVERVQAEVLCRAPARSRGSELACKMLRTG